MEQRAFDFAAPDPMPAHCPTAKAEAPPCDPRIDPEDAARLVGQNGEILALLRSKPEVSNAELVRVANKYTGRLSEIRKAGHAIKARRGEGGVWWYSLVEPRP